MRTFYKYIFSLALIGLCRNAGAQDIHYSQFNSSPLNINPSLTGLFDGEARIVLNHRDQWRSITVPYRTSSASVDVNFKATKQSKDFIGAGILVNTDKAGDSEFGTVQVLGNLSYTKKFESAGDLFFTYGMSAGLSQRSLNYQNLRFDSQYNGDKFDPNIPSGENFQSNNFSFFEASAGVNGFYGFNEHSNLNAGFAMHHLNKPDQSLMGNDITLKPRYTFHTNSQIFLTEKFDLMPGFLILSQGANSQMNIGAYTKYKIKSTPGEKRAVYLGTWFRLKDRDAFILSARIDYNTFNLGLSYDFNFSDLSVASQYRGGFEVSLIYILQKTKPRIRLKNIPCPIFM